ncbi:MAG: TetR/AcrR family transcriptional regulator [Kofleriaceae bacterium]|nr:TetR/AcrR family transcriptional regulator [Kofleriaceae bacterium]
MLKKPPEPAPRRSDSQEIVLAVIAAAIELGPDTPLARIAERAGVGLASLHRYFPTTAALFAEVSREMYRTLVRQVRDLLERTDLSVAETVVQVCRVVITEPKLPVEHRRRLNFGVPLEWSRDSAEAAYRDILRDVVGYLQRRWTACGPDIEDRVFVAFAAVRGAVLVSLLFPDLGPPEERMIQQVTRCVTLTLGLGEPPT